MLADETPGFDKYAPFLKESTINGMAILYLSGMMTTEATLKNLADRDMGKITNEAFFELEMQRIKKEHR